MHGVTMSHPGFFIKCRPLGLICSIFFLASCAGLASHGEFQTPGLTLTLTLSKPEFAWGEPVLARVTLANTAATPVSLPIPDQASLAFTFQPQSKTDPAQLRFVEPVVSSKYQPGAAIDLGPAGSPQSVCTRDFVFTTLSFERGGYVMAAVYTQPSASPVHPAKKTYAKATVFTIAGDKPVAHRYLDGLITREDAVAIAAAAAGAQPQRTDSILAIDPAGYAKWWVNVTLPGGGVKAYLIDPYFAKVWREERPFTANDKGAEPALPKDSKVLQQLRDRTERTRTR